MDVDIDNVEIDIVETDIWNTYVQNWLWKAAMGKKNQQQCDSTHDTDN